MNTTNIMLVMLFLIVLVGMWQSRRMKKFVFCTYTSRSKQSYDKVVPEQNSYVIFEGKKFYLLPSYGKLRLYEKGLSAFFPTKITAYDFRWNSPYPVDPNTGDPAMLSPDVEKTLDQEGAMRDYAGSQQQALSGKGKLGGLDRWMPFIMIGLAIAIVYCIYMVYQMKSDQDIIKQAISDIFNKIGIK
jgi:hypothetical protein